MVKLIQEYTKDGTDPDFCIFMMEMPVYYNFDNSDSTCNDVIEINDYLNSLIRIPNKESIPENWKSYVPSSFCFHVHNYCQISFVKSGSMLYFINNKLAEVNRNELIIINSHMPHSWVAAKGTEVIMSSFYPNLVFEGLSESDVATVVNTIFSNQFPFIIVTDSCESSKTVLNFFMKS